VFFRVKRILTIFLIAAFCDLSAQNLREMGLFVGGMNYTGDLSKKFITTNETYPAVGLMYRTNLDGRLDVRYSLIFGTIGGKDANYAAEDHDRYIRNLSFRSPVYELSASVLYNFRTFVTGTSKDDYAFTPYLGLGLGIFHFDPQTKLNYKLYHLRSLPTELGKPHYYLTTLCIPFNAGVKILFTDKVCVTADFGYRKTFTDYLDDVSGKYADYKEVESQYGKDVATLTDRSREYGPEYNRQKLNDPNSKVNRGDSRNKDNYLYLGISLSYYYQATNAKKWRLPKYYWVAKARITGNKQVAKTDEQKQEEIREAERKAAEREAAVEKQKVKEKQDSLAQASKLDSVSNAKTIADSMAVAKQNEKRVLEEREKFVKDSADKSNALAKKETEEAAAKEKEAAKLELEKKKKVEADSVTAVKAEAKKQAQKAKAKRRSKSVVGKLQRKWERYLNKRRFKKGRF
jgi:hypothetical protein